MAPSSQLNGSVSPTENSTTNDTSVSTLSSKLSTLNSQTLDNLITLLSRIRTSNNLLVLDQQLSNLINSLTPFSQLKSHGHFDKIVWFKSLPLHRHQQEELGELLSQFSTLILIVKHDVSNLQVLKKIVGFVNEKKIGVKLNLIIPNVGKSDLFEINQALSGYITGQTFDRILKYDEVLGTINLSAGLKLSNWVVNPFYLQDDQTVVLDCQHGGVESYLQQPLQQLNKLADLVIKLITLDPESVSKPSIGKFIKLKNIYGKGDHSKLLINMIQNEKLPDFLNSKITKLEQSFYQEKLSGNADLVVVERNLDWLPVLMNQLNYQGLIDDLFEIRDEFNLQISIPNNNTDHLNGIGIDGNADSSTHHNLKLSDDELYKNLKDLNFASIGNKLNTLAKFIQSQYQSKDNLKDLKEIKKLVSNLGSLTMKQDLIKKHTTISESILNFIKQNGSAPTPNQYEFFLEFENDLFDLDYKQQTNYIIRFLDECYDMHLVISSLALVSIVNDGIKEKDFDLIKMECLQNYGPESLLIIDHLIKLEVIVVIAAAQSDFLGAITGLSLGGNNTNTTAQQNSGPSTSESEGTLSYDDLDKVAISGGQRAYKNNYTLINKFWNLHPLLDEDFQQFEQQQQQQLGKPDAEAAGTDGANASASSEEDNHLIAEYPHPSFALPSNTVPLICRLVESLYFRDFLKYKPVNNLRRRPNWDNLGLDNMFKGKTVDINLCDTSDDRKAATSQQNKIRPVEYVIVVLIGGITRSELSVFKYLQQTFNKHGHNKEIVILTSGIINNRKFLDYLKSA